jgi:protein SCO1/2
MTFTLPLRTIAVGLALLALTATARAGTEDAVGRLDPKQVIARSEGAIGRMLGSYRLTDIKGQELALSTLRSKPLVISLIYSSCSSVCPVTTQRLQDAVDEANRVFGADNFNVLTLGFDARNDSPARMAHFASVQGIKAPNWRVASADAATVTAILRELGFSYATAAGGIDHITQTTIVDRDGRVYRHVYGEDFPIRMFMEPLKDVVYGTTSLFTFGGLVDRIKFICTTFDPGAGRYRSDYGLVFGSVIAAFSLMVFGGLIAREWVKSTRRA